MRRIRDWLRSACLTDSFALIVILAFALLSHFRNKRLVLNWPALDIIPLVQVILGQHVAAGDFATDTAVEPNPRFIFAYIAVFLVRLFGIDIAGALAVIRAIVYVGIPVAAYFFMAARLDRTFGRSPVQRIALCVLLPLVFFNSSVVGNISVAWWRPVLWQATPQTLSLLLAILSGLAFQKEGRSAAIVSWALVAVSVLLHPAVGLFWVAFISVIMLDRETPITRFLAYAAAASISVAMVGVVYHQQSDLSAQEFADIYARLAHFGHYIPTLYSSFSGQRWFIPLVILSGVLAATGAGLWFGERSKLAIASWTAAVAVNLAIATQYVLVELYPVSSVVQLGPSRFTQFGGWFLVYFGAALVCVGMKYVWPAPEIPETTLSRRFSVIWVTAVFLVIFGTSKLNYVTKPAIAETMNWIAHNTKAEDRVVAALPAVHAARILADRPVIAGYNFPFHVMHFREFRARTEMIYGSAHEREALDGSNAGSGSQRFFGQHGPCAFLEMRRKYGADIAVVETRFAAPLSGEMPVARNDELSVYLIRDFKARDCEARS